MKKKIVKFISLTLVFCMLISSVAFAEEARPISNMTYEEWLTEQEGVSSLSNTVQSDLEPVMAASHLQEQISNVSSVYSTEKSGNKLLDSILKEKGKYGLNKGINVDLVAESVTTSITKDVESIDDTESVSNVEATDDVESTTGDAELSSDVESIDDAEPASDAELM